MTALEDAVGVIAVSNGGAALAGALLNILHYRDHLVAVLESDTRLPTPLRPFFEKNLPRFGIGATCHHFDNISSVEASITERTKVLFIELSETEGQPSRDLAPWKALCEKHNLLLMAEVSSLSPHFATTKALGVGVGVITDSRFLAGRQENLAGFIIDSGLYDWATGRFEELREPNPNAQGKVFTTAFKQQAYIMKVCNEMVRDFGFSLAPMEAFLIMQGIESLLLRTVGG
jgi:O-acetylhomoserine (thiol)-lyase